MLTAGGPTPFLTAFGRQISFILCTVIIRPRPVKTASSPPPSTACVLLRWWVLKIWRPLSFIRKKAAGRDCGCLIISAGGGHVEQAGYSLSRCAGRPDNQGCGIQG